MICVECKADRLLVEKIARVGKKDIIHEGGKSRVLRLLQRQGNLIGLVDEDPGATQPRVLKQYTLANRLSSSGIKVLKRGESTLIVLCPRLEEWIIEAARECGLNMADFRLPDDGNKLHREINSSLERLASLLDNLLQKQCRRIIELRELLVSASVGETTEVS